MSVLIFASILILIDQISKKLVVEFLKGKPPAVIIENFLNFFYLENRGAAFGIMQNNRTFFLIITIVIVIAILYILFKNYKKSSAIFKLSLGLILGGAIGNFIDRVRLHYVIDFISVRIFGFDFAVFNLADSFVVIGSFLLVLMVLFYDNPEKR
ncbi:signal peptidase II [Peptoniphilus sp. ING2-D1G]|nr:signal peptidase II [Peptoniphilus sp. ING2-D1G]